MKIDNYLENLNDDDRNTFYYLLGEMGVDDKDIEVLTEETSSDITRVEFLKQEIKNTNNKILKIIHGAYTSGRIDEKEFKYEIGQIKDYMFMISELEREVENEEEGEC